MADLDVCILFFCKFPNVHRGIGAGHQLLATDAEHAVAAFLRVQPGFAPHLLATLQINALTFALFTAKALTVGTGGILHPAAAHTQLGVLGHTNGTAVQTHPHIVIEGGVENGSNVICTELL